MIDEEVIVRYNLYLEVRLDVKRQQYVIEDIGLFIGVEEIDNIRLYKVLKENYSVRIPFIKCFSEISESYTTKPTLQFTEYLPVGKYVRQKAIELMKNYGMDNMKQDNLEKITPIDRLNIINRMLKNFYDGTVDTASIVIGGNELLVDGDIFDRIICILLEEKKALERKIERTMSAEEIYEKLDW